MVTSAVHGCCCIAVSDFLWHLEEGKGIQQRIIILLKSDIALLGKSQVSVLAGRLLFVSSGFPASTNNQKQKTERA